MLFQGKMAIFSDVWLILSNRFLGGEGKRGRRGRQEGKKRKNWREEGRLGIVGIEEKFRKMWAG